MARSLTQIDADITKLQTLIDSRLSGDPVDRVEAGEHGWTNMSLEEMYRVMGMLQKERGRATQQSRGRLGRFIPFG